MFILYPPYSQNINHPCPFSTFTLRLTSKFFESALLDLASSSTILCTCSSLNLFGAFFLTQIKLCKNSAKVILVPRRRIPLLFNASASNTLLEIYIYSFFPAVPHPWLSQKLLSFPAFNCSFRLHIKFRRSYGNELKCV